MASTELSPPSREDRYDWRSAGLRYFAYGWYLRARFGCRVQRISVDGQFSCPHADAATGRGGCTFCDNRSFSPSRRRPPDSIPQQIAAGIGRVGRRYSANRFLAYFQPGANTHAPLDRLRQLYEEALAHPQIAGLAISTRPDCLPNDVLDLLEQLARRTYLTLELGIQTMHDRSLDWMNRGHHHQASVDAVRRSRGRGFHIAAHVILGVPGESREEMLATARELARLRVDAVKIHNLHAVKDTPLGDMVRRGEVSLIGRREYLEVLVEFLELLPPATIIQRISGDAPPEYLIEPAWCLDKAGLRRELDGQLSRRDTRQGQRWAP
jgi:radical SAM protein (TIGR01212 family)